MPNPSAKKAETGGSLVVGSLGYIVKFCKKKNKKTKRKKQKKNQRKKRKEIRSQQFKPSPPNM